eukprot:GEMP01009334.1.p1 GENE.GEMP01009334.1~~GEMP01009334.1.p1  ORF type:complete len:1001 (+),score=246.13 GEMP01009334.1:37-3039(+)
MPAKSFMRRRPPALLNAQDLLSATTKTPHTDLVTWTRLGQRAIALVNTMTWKNLALISNSFARADVRDGKLFKRVSDRLREDLEMQQDLEPKEIALLVNAYAKLDFRDEGLFRDVGQYLVHRGVSDFGEQHLALVVHSWGKFKFRDPLLLRLLFRRAMDICDSLTAQALANIASGAAKLGERDRELFATFARSITTTEREYELQHVANLLTAFAKVGFKDPAVVAKLAQEVLRRSRSLAPVEAAATIGALVKLEHRDFRIYNVICDRVREDVKRYQVPQLAQVVHALSMVHPEWSDAFEDLAQPLRRHIYAMDDVTTLLVLAAYARAQVNSGNFVELLLTRLEPAVPLMTDQGLANFVYAMSRIRQKPPLLLEAVELLQQRAPDLGSQHVANSLYALARLGIRNETTNVLFERVRNQGNAKVWEPQHVANILAAAAELRPDVDVHTPLGYHVVNMVDQFSAQLLSSVASSYAALECRDTAVFRAIAERIRLAERPGEQVSSNTIVAFVNAHQFHEPLYSWALEDLLQRPNAPLELMCHAAQAVLYTDFHFHHFTRIDGVDGAVRSSLFFPQASEGFQLLCERFIRQLGHILLDRSKHVYVDSVRGLTDALSASGLAERWVPFELLRSSCSVPVAPALNLPFSDSTTVSGPTVLDSLMESLPHQRPSADTLCTYLQLSSTSKDFIISSYAQTCDPVAWDFADVCSVLHSLGTAQAFNRPLLSKLAARAGILLEDMHQQSVLLPGFWKRWGQVLGAVQGLPCAVALVEATKPLLPLVSTEELEVDSLSTLVGLAPEFIAVALRSAKDADAGAQLNLLASMARYFGDPPEGLEDLAAVLVTQAMDSDTPWGMRNAAFDDSVAQILLALLKNPTYLQDSRDHLLQALQRHLAASPGLRHVDILCDILLHATSLELVPLAVRLSMYRLNLSEQVKVSYYLALSLEHEDVVGEALVRFLNKVIWQKKHMGPDELQRMKLMVSLIRLEFPHFFGKLQESTQLTLTSL